MVTSYEEIEEALEIRVPESEHLVMEDCRRITGPGLLWSLPGALLDVLVSEPYTLKSVTKLWEGYARRILDDIGWTNEDTKIRHYDGGASLAISAPMDALYSAVFTAQTIWHHCASDLLDQEADDYVQMIDDLKAIIAKEANPALIDLIRAAKDHHVDILSDDEEVSIGHGAGSQVWSVLEPPKPSDVDWKNLHDVPLALITGTNGKTTSVRLSTAIAAATGKVAGLTSTDFIRVGRDVLDYGDYSGPGGARMLLRDKRLEIAFLEVARGGILRRGLPIQRARAALVTNVAADHLGQYGINTVPELASVKLSVHRALSEDGVLILNADDEFIIEEAKNITANIWWFSLDQNLPHIKEARQAGKPCAWMDRDDLAFFDGVTEIKIICVKDIPLAMGGAAQYNVRNALGALCLARAMGTSDAAIREGLSTFKSNPKDNPGRCNEFDVKGARVFVDFAHNPHSIEAVTTALGSLDAKRRFLMVGHAGDRSDEDIKSLLRGAFAFRPDYVIANETPEYLRGRELGEIQLIVRDECLKLGLTSDNVILAGSTAEGVTAALSRLEEGDVALLLVLSDRDKAFELIENAAKG